MTLKIDLLKKEQRNFLSKKRNNFKEKVSLNNNFFIQNLILSNWFVNSRIISSFLSINSEISTSSLNNFITSQNKILCLPVVEKKNNGCLEFRAYKNEEDLMLGNFNIKEPKNGKVFLPNIIFTPCLGFDLHGHRLGYGGGYYDKTISSLKSRGHTFTTVGFAYDYQKVDKIVHDKYDQRLNYILTEKQLYKSL